MFTLKEIVEREGIIARGERGKDPLADLFLQDTLSETQIKVLELVKNPVYRSYIEASLLATDDVQEISDLIGISYEVLALFRECFYPVTNLTKFEKVYLVELGSSVEDKNLKRWAVTQGMDFLAWRMGFKVEISPVEGMSSLYADCFFKAKEAFFNVNSTEASKEALKWAKQASDISRLLKSWVSNNKEASSEIEIALENCTEESLEFGDLTEITESNGEELDFVKPEFGSFDEILDQNSD